jgi:aquaporin Z
MNSSSTNPAPAVVARHWPEYLMEGAQLGLFMLAACACSVMLDHPRSVVHGWIEDASLRRALAGFAMGATAIALIYSPWGRQSGAHFNPAVTLNFWRMGKMRGVDALGYCAGQFSGGVLGVVLARALIGRAVGEPPVNWAATVPGSYGTAGAFFGEFVISFLHITTVLFISNHSKLAPHTGWFAGLLVAGWITIEGPLSGMSMNPARTFASGFPGNIWTGAWIYYTAPVFGMLAGGYLFGWLRGRRPAGCPKLVHPAGARCIFCGHRVSEAATKAARSSATAMAPPSMETLT